jgi:hypothetical protein
MLKPDRVDALVRDTSATIVGAGLLYILLGIRQVTPLPWEVDPWGYCAPLVIALAAAAYAGWWAEVTTKAWKRAAAWASCGGAILVAISYILVLLAWWIGWSCYES